ncbi:DMT family transporter [Salinarimonas sp.]|uniref:DMT family transporter n=1 Tax=Salinarimonas sp. TaxID=2766526 RepID=UPI0032D92862
MTTAEAGRADDLGRAVVYMILAAISLPLLNASAKYLTSEYHVLQIAWARYAGHFVYMFVAFAPRRGAALLRTSRWRMQLLRSSLLCAATLIYITALSDIALTTAAAISFTAPFIVTALAPAVLGERVDLRRWTAVAVGFAGALIVIRPGHAIDLAALLVLGSATASALYQLLSRKLAASEPADTSITYVAITGFVLLSFPLPFVWRTPETAADVALLAGLGLFGGLGHYCMGRAFELAPAPFVSPFTYLQLVGATLLGFLVFGHLPDAWVWAGALIIVASGAYILVAARGRAGGPKTPPRRAGRRAHRPQA